MYQYTYNGVYSVGVCNVCKIPYGGDFMTEDTMTEDTMTEIKHEDYIILVLGILTFIAIVWWGFV